MSQRTGTMGLVGALLLIACGDDDDGTPVSSGLPANEKLSGLDQTDAKKLCESFASSFNSSLSDSDKKRITCSALALPLSIKVASGGKIEGDAAKCKDLVARCEKGETISTADAMIDVDAAHIDASTSCSAEANDANFSSCDATVKQFETCASAAIDGSAAKFELFNCDALSDPEKLMKEASEDFDVKSLPECKDLYATCPDISFGDPSTDDSSSGT